MLRNFIILILLSFQSVTLAAAQYAGYKIMLLHSYHPEYIWTQDITHHIEQRLAETGVELEIFYMDTKRRATIAEKKASALKAKAAIDNFAPNVIIAADDDASKYVIMPYYIRSDIPVVFYGVNWDASAYGFTKEDSNIPQYPNITGMVEQHIIAPVIKQLSQYATGNRIGFLSFDGISERKTFYYFEKILNRSFDKVYFHTNYSDWKDSYLKLQQEVDMLVMYNADGLKGWDLQDAIQFVEQHIQIPIGTTNYSRMPFSVFGMVQVRSEHANWAVETALRILDGEKPSNIPVTHNKEGRLVLNMRLINKLGLKVDLKLLKIAEIIK